MTPSSKRRGRHGSRRACSADRAGSRQFRPRALADFARALPPESRARRAEDLERADPPLVDRRARPHGQKRRGADDSRRPQRRRFDHRSMGGALSLARPRRRRAAGRAARHGDFAARLSAGLGAAARRLGADPAPEAAVENAGRRQPQRSLLRDRPRARLRPRLGRGIPRHRAGRPHQHRGGLRPLARTAGAAQFADFRLTPRALIPPRGAGKLRRSPGEDADDARFRPDRRRRRGAHADRRLSRRIEGRCRPGARRGGDPRRAGARRPRRRGGRRDADGLRAGGRPRPGAGAAGGARRRPCRSASARPPSTRCAAPA